MNNSIFFLHFKKLTLEKKTLTAYDNIPNARELTQDYLLLQLNQPSSKFLCVPLNIGLKDLNENAPKSMKHYLIMLSHINGQLHWIANTHIDQQVQ